MQPYRLNVGRKCNSVASHQSHKSYMGNAIWGLVFRVCVFKQSSVSIMFEKTYLKYYMWAFYGNPAKKRFAPGSPHSVLCIFGKCMGRCHGARLPHSMIFKLSGMMGHLLSFRVGPGHFLSFCVGPLYHVSRFRLIIFCESLFVSKTIASCLREKLKHNTTELWAMSERKQRTNSNQRKGSGPNVMSPPSPAHRRATYQYHEATFGFSEMRRICQIWTSIIGQSKRLCYT